MWVRDYIRNRVLNYEPKSGGYEWVNYLSSLRYSTPPKVRFIFWAGARSGSHLLADLLNTHPDICCVSEYHMFGKKRRIFSPYNYIDGVSKRLSKQKRSGVFGGKINIFQLDRQFHANASVIEKLHANGWKFIVLQRQNLLDQAISGQVARQRKQFHDSELPSLAMMQIEINIPDLHQRMEQRHKHNQRLQELLASYNVLTVNYENDLVGQVAQQRTANRVFDFLSVTPVTVKTDYVKTGVYAFSDYIKNYDELVASLQGTPYATYLSVTTM